MAPKNHVTWQLKVPLEGKPPADLDAVVYAFGAQGALLGSSPVKSGSASLEIDNDKVPGARVLIGPALPEHRANEEPTLARLQRLGAYEAPATFSATTSPTLSMLPESVWKSWLWCRCLVRGQVVRTVSVGGSLQDLPVCGARVHLCEVDPILLILRRLPDELIYRLRSDLLGELRKPHPLPDPPPDALRAFAMDPSPANFAPRADLDRTRVGIRTREPVPEALDAGAPSEAPAWLGASTVRALREQLIANVDFIRPYLCWPWLWPWYRCDEFAVLETDANGRFETRYGHPCFGDQPDVYAWVEFSLGGVWATVYDPGVACDTHWDYTCGDDITIRLTDPRVPVCGEPPESPGMSVTIVGIGENVSSHELQMAATGANQGLTTNFEPFGGVLEPRVLFGRTALLAAGITHYRWSYRRLTASDGVTPASDPDPHYLDAAVGRHYAMPSGVVGVGPSYPVESMGPSFGADRLFKIQPFAPSPLGNDGWAIVDSHQDNATAFFPTQLLAADPESAAGQYELKFELFKIVAGVPALVDLTAAGVELFIPDQDAPFGSAPMTSSPPTTDQFYFRDPGSGHIVAFRLVLRIDNNISHGNIEDVSVSGVGAGPCGFIEYAHGASAVVAFTASHPHGFATFGFSVYRGAGCEVTSAGGSVSDSAANGYTRSGTQFAQGIPVSTLLGYTTDPVNCPACVDRAAFAEALWVHATATDGWYRLEAYDAPRGGPSERANKAFALEPHHRP